MSIEARREYLQEIKMRYQKARKKEKKLILDEFCQVCQYERKHAIKLLNKPIEIRSQKPGPEVTYHAEVIKHLVLLWRFMGEICSKNMKAAMPGWLPFYQDCDEGIKALLIKISPSTIDRALKSYRHALRRGLSSTRPSLIKSRIPIQLLDHAVTEPGFEESDTVAHCGESLSGTFANSLTMTDLFSGWTDNRATLGKASKVLLPAIKNIEKDLPFVLLGFASDNGSEFLNEDVYLHFKRREKPVKFVRRRAYKKNDNAHVEQKNWTHVRELFGYERIETQELVDLMNDIYQNNWNLVKNFFTPSMKLKSKTRIGAKIKKVYDQPKTPYHRLMEYPGLSDWAKGKLLHQYQRLNPFELKKELDRKLNFFFRIVEIEKDKRKRSQTGS